MPGASERVRHNHPVLQRQRPRCRCRGQGGLGKRRQRPCARAGTPCQPKHLQHGGSAGKLGAWLVGCSTWLGRRGAGRGRAHHARGWRAHRSWRGRHVTMRAARRGAALRRALRGALRPTLLGIVIVGVLLALQQQSRQGGRGSMAGQRGGHEWAVGWVGRDVGSSCLAPQQTGPAAAARGGARPPGGLDALGARARTCGCGGALALASVNRRLAGGGCSSGCCWGGGGPPGGGG